MVWGVWDGLGWSGMVGMVLDRSDIEETSLPIEGNHPHYCTKCRYPHHLL